MIEMMRVSHSKKKIKKAPSNGLILSMFSGLAMHGASSFHMFEIWAMVGCICFFPKIVGFLRWKRLKLSEGFVLRVNLRCSSWFSC